MKPGQTSNAAAGESDRLSDWQPQNQNAPGQNRIGVGPGLIQGLMQCRAMAVVSQSPAAL